jgi:uncharacterized membrane protein YkvA (DUF1232 family)
MAEKRNILSNQNSGFFQDLILRAKLILRLIRDPRINFLLKLMPIGAIIYVVSPIDLIPGAVLPIIGALDDAVVLWLGTTLFVSLCPEDVVQEHMNALQKVVPGTWRDVEEKETTDVIEAESRDMPEDDK